jgi:hypothetical protein
MVRFQIGHVEVQAEFNDSHTARKLLEALPFKADGNYWGGEIYFEVPVHCAYEKDAREVVDPGTVAFWPAGDCLCIFWGPTPASRGEECRAASKVNVVGRVVNPEVLPKLRGSRVRVAVATEPRP